MKYCENCGSKVFNGHCVSCHEETYIAEQVYENPIEMSEEFWDKVKMQKEEAKEIRDKKKRKEGTRNDISYMDK